MAQARTKTRAITEFGDFQTPAVLAFAVTEKLRRLGLRPRAIIEPTCGEGAFLVAAADSFPDAETIIGVEINAAYVHSAAATLLAHGTRENIQMKNGDFFALDWPRMIEAHAGPWLILGNPPWVTSSSLGTLSSANLPDKSNFHGRTGIEAVTGKSNFDISEWMLLQYLEWLKGCGTIAVLCKTSVARKILAHVWKHSGALFSHIYKIDAMAHFGAAVDACLFVLGLTPQANCKTCEVYDSFDDVAPSSMLGFWRGHLVADALSVKLDELWGPETHYIWRSGIKHDCARVMELFLEADGYRNGVGETVQIEETFLYPMLKGSDIGNGRISPRAKMIVTQEAVGQSTHRIASLAPNTWTYLTRHHALLDRRGSIIYRNKPDFSIFGVGPYTFAPWKLAVSSFYKKLLFVSVGSIEGRTVVFDDTVYFLPCESEREARFLEDILHSNLAARFLNSMIHWSDKRPLTIDLLKRLSIKNLAVALGRSDEYQEFSRTARAQDKQSNFSFV